MELGFVITEAAWNKIQKHCKQKGYKGVRIGVRSTGCSGLAYTMEYELGSTTEEDGVENKDGYFVACDPKAMVYLRGMTVDYVRQGLQEGFEFVNPNEKDRCGCGESFRV